MPDLSSLKAYYDVVVIGGGVTGAATALEATRRGYEVLLVEKGDFCCGASSNSLKIIHGGLRYLKSVDLARSRESAREQRHLMRMVPHLVRPLLCLVGTDRTLSGGRAAMSLGLWLYDHVVCAGLGEWPAGRSLPVEEGNRLAGFNAFEGCTGVVSWHDAQTLDSERLVLTYLKTAESGGADLRNYVAATEVGSSGGGLVVSIRGTRDAGTVSAGHVIDTASLVKPYPSWTRAVNLVMRRRPGDHAFGRKLSHPSRDSGRLFFATPFRDRLIIGTWYFPDCPGDGPALGADEYRQCVADARDLLPGLDITAEDVSMVHLGRLPVADAGKPLSLIERPVIHTLEDEPRIITVTGVKYTTARPTAAKALDKAGLRTGPAGERHTTCYGTAALANDLESEVDKWLRKVESPRDGIVRRLCSQYGSVAREIARRGAQRPGELERIPGQNGVRAEIEYCMEEEFCRSVSDFLLRRSGIGSLGAPPDETVRYCAMVMAQRLDWADERIESEIRELSRRYVCFTD